jgi:predicted peptidase
VRFAIVSMLLAVVLVPTPAHATAFPDSVGHFEFRTVTVSHDAHRFAVWVPPGFDSTRAWPAIVFLHGSGECGTDGERPTRVGLGPELTAHPRRWPCVVVFPQKPIEDEQWETRAALVLAALRLATREFHVDTHRVALAGLSQGGHGTWTIGARYPKRWTCLAPICGYGAAAVIAPRVAGLPVWAFHGLRDDVVNPDETRAMVEAIRAKRARLGLDPAATRLTLYPDDNHGSWDSAVAEPELPGWILGQPPRPASTGTR